MRIILAGLLVLGSVQVVHAFDGKRQGFVLGMGLGVGNGSFTVDVIEDGRVDRTIEGDEFGGASNLKIGFGVDEQFLIYYGASGMATSSLASGVFGPGFSVYFSDESPSMYVLAAGGFAFVIPDGIVGSLGTGVSGGFGWEFSRHWSGEATLSWISGSKDQTGGSLFASPEPGFDANTWSAQVTVAGLAY